MGDVVPFARPAPRNRRAGHHRPCACPLCRRCSVCKDLVEALGIPQAKSCALENCPMRGTITIEDVFEEFGKVVFALPAKQKPVKK